MRAALAIALLVGCSYPPHAPEPVRVDRLLAARTSAELRALLVAPVGYGGLWFRDPACATEFAGAGPIGADRLDDFARCLSTLHLETTTLRHPYGDVIELTYDPGFAVEAELGDGGDRLRWIGYAGRHDMRDALPAITGEALEALRSAGSASPPLDDAARARLAGEQAQTGLAFSSAWMKVCIDAEGNVTGAHPRQVTSPIAGEVFAASVADWRFRPFVVDGHAIPACAMILLAEPRSAAPTGEVTTVPYPVPPDLGSVVVSPAAIKRLVGTGQIQPEDLDKTFIMQHGLSRIVVAYLFCIDGAGNVAGVRKIRGSVLERYDAQLGNAILGWKYKPFLVDGKPMPVCSGVTFIYQQISR